MPVDIQSLRNKKIPVKFEFYGAEITVFYPLKLYDPAFREEWAKREDELSDEYRDWVQGLLDAYFDEQGIDEDDRSDPIVKKAAINEITRNFDVNRRMWANHAQLACMLIDDWDITDDGRKVPVEPHVFTDGTLPPELARVMCREIWDDVRKLGNRNASAKRN